MADRVASHDSKNLELADAIAGERRLCNFWNQGTNLRSPLLCVLDRMTMVKERLPKIPFADDLAKRPKSKKRN